MKKILRQYLLPLVVLLFSTTCTKDFEQTNANPNAPEKVPATNILLSGITNGFSNALSMIIYAFGGVGFEPTGFWCQHLAETIPIYDIDKYVVSLADTEIPWRRAYSGSLQDLQTIIDDPANGANMRAAAMTIRAYQFSVVTDLFGDVPYTQANQVGRYIQPEYDTQESIYKDLTAQLALAATMFDPAGDALGEGDVLYEGDILKWKKFANTLRARLLNRYKHKDANALQALKDLLNDPVAYPVFESSADNASLVMPGEQPYQAAMYYFWTNSTSRYFSISKTLVDVLKNGNDPRLPIFANPNANGEFVGQQNGAPQPAVGTISDIGEFFVGNPNYPLAAMTYPELLFIRAEVFNDKQAYDAGIAAAMAAVGTAPVPASAAAADAAWNTNPLEAIITQKWVLLFLNEPEAWSEYRRTGYPSTLQEALNSVFPGQGVPRRYAYPPIEETTNKANLDAARARQHIEGGKTIFGDKMWWVQ